MISGLLRKAWKGGRLLVVGGSQWLKPLRFGTAAAVEHVAVLRQLREVRTVVDVGANRGQFALAAKFCFPKARIIAFEPLPGPATKFERVFRGKPDVILHRAAIGPHAGEEIIHVSGCDDSSSLLPITGIQERLFPGTEEKSTQSVRVGRLSDFLSQTEVVPAALLKLDVQGFELQALESCVDLLRRFAWIYAECSFLELYEGQALADQVIAWLQDQGFALKGVYNMSYGPRGEAVQADFLFEQ